MPPAARNPQIKKHLAHGGARTCSPVAGVSRPSVRRQRARRCAHPLASPPPSARPARPTNDRCPTARPPADRRFTVPARPSHGRLPEGMAERLAGGGGVLPQGVWSSRMLGCPRTTPQRKTHLHETGSRQELRCGPMEPPVECPRHSGVIASVVPPGVFLHTDTAAFTWAYFVLTCVRIHVSHPIEANLN